MPVLDLTPGDNPRAPGVLTLTAEGTAGGVTLSTDGTVTCDTVSAGTISYTDLAVTGDATVGGTLDVTGTMHSDGALTTDASLGVTGAANLLGTLLVDGDITANSSLSVGANLSVTGIGKFDFVRKTANQTVTNSSDYVDDNHLVLPVVANATYLMDGLLLYTGPSAGDMQVQFTGPAGASLAWTTRGAGAPCDATLDEIETGAGILGGGKILGCYAAGTTQAATPTGIFRTAATAGNLLVRWSQYVANATVLTLYTDSYLTLRRVA